MIGYVYNMLNDHIEHCKYIYIDRVKNISTYENDIVHIGHTNSVKIFIAI